MPVKIFFCYAHEDDALLKKLKKHLKPLQREGLIELWHDRDISAGSQWEREISEHLNIAQVILLLVSPDFMNSDYCYSKEMRRALERHEQKEAHVIPVILRYVYWQGALGQLQALPTDALPITDPDWYDIDRALYNVTEGIRKVVEELTPKSDIPLPVPPIQALKTEQSLLSSLNVLKREPGKSQPLIKSEDFSLPIIKPEDFSLLRTLAGHSAWITSIVFSPDGQTFASASDDDTIKLWNLQTGELLCTLTGHSEGIRSLTISSDGQTFASGGSDGTIKLWNLQTGELLYTLTGHSDEIRGIAFSSDGQTLFSGANDAIKLWNLQTGELLYTLTGHLKIFYYGAFSPDGQTLASGSDDGTIKLWNMQSGEQLYTLTGHSEGIHSVAFSSDGHVLASGGNDRKIKLWNLQTGELLYTLTGHSAAICSLAFSPDGQILASGSCNVRSFKLSVRSFSGRFWRFSPKPVIDGRRNVQQT